MVIKSSSFCLSADSSTTLVKINKVYFKALSFYEQNNWKAAKTAFQDFLSLSDQNPLYIPSLYYLANCYMNLKEQQKSVSIYEKIIAQASPEDDFWSQMAQQRLEQAAKDINSPN